MEEPRQHRSTDTVKSQVALWVMPGIVTLLMVVGGAMLSDVRNSVQSGNAQISAVNLRMERIDTQLTERALFDGIRQEGTSRRLDQIERDLKALQYGHADVDKRLSHVEARGK